jgi:hypothetical protein
MGLGTIPRPHHITWDYRAGYCASRRDAADTTHFLSSVSHQARKRDRIAHPEPIQTRQSGHPACRPGRDRVVCRSFSLTVPVRNILPLSYRFEWAFHG